MRYLFLLLSFIGSIYSASSDVSTAQKQSKFYNKAMVVGSVREPSGAKEHLAIAVDYFNANYSYSNGITAEGISSKNTFSYDRRRLSPESKKFSAQHIVGDFALDQNIPECTLKFVLFEWLPSVNGSVDRKNTYHDVNLTKEAATAAFRMLQPGAKLAIDFWPYTLDLPSDYMQALLQINGICFKDKNTFMREILTKAHEEDPEKTKKGSLAKAWQQLNPFLFVVSSREKADLASLIFTRLTYELKGVEAVTQCFDVQINPDAAKKAWLKTAEIFSISEENMLTILSQDNLVMQDEIHTPEKTAFFCCYHMFSRSQYMYDCLEQIGFDVAEDALNFYNINPYNKRKNAWILTATKPQGV